MRNEYIPVKGVHSFDKAHVVMLIEQKIITKKDGIKILRALLEMERKREGYEIIRKKVGGGGHSGEAYLIEKLGVEIGGQIHLGRSSADLIGVAIRIEERDHILQVLHGLYSLVKTLLHISKNQLMTVLPAYTHFQQAQPITLAHYFVSWVYALMRDIDRFKELYLRINSSPAGAAIVSGSAFQIDRRKVAELLGFDMVLQNTRDAIFGYDPHLELFSKIAILNNNIARLCSDLYIWSSSEFRMVELKDRFCGTSSINPSKKNPQAFEQIFSLAASSIGSMNTAFAVDRMPSDAWEVQWRVWSQDLWPIIQQTIKGLTLTDNVIATMEFKTNRMAELAQSGWITASDLAALLVNENKIAWRIAHQIVAQLVRECERKGLGASGITPDLIDKIAEERLGKKLSLSKEAIKKALDPRESVKGRHLIGGPAPEQMIKQMKECAISLRKYEAEIFKMCNKLIKANKRLDLTITNIVRKRSTIKMRK
jgi:argininosuccinate lyase